MIFRQDWKTGAVTIDEWDKEGLFTYEVVRLMDSSILKRDGNDIYITVANGRAHYRIVEDQPEYETYKAILVEGRYGSNWERG